MISFNLVIQILEATGDTFLRLWLLMAVSVFIATGVGILAARVRIAELILIPIVDVLEAVPVISFFPIILVFFLKDIGGSVGTNLAVDVLIITALVWNIIIGVYQAVSHIPKELLESSFAFKLGLWKRLRYLYIPSSVQKIVANVMPSFASGLFYITLSEVISFGAQSFHVFGVGEVAVDLAQRSDLAGTLLLILVLVVAIILNFLFIINPLNRYAEKFSLEFETKGEEIGTRRRRSTLLNAVSQRTGQVVGSITHLLSSVNRVASRIQIPVTSSRRRLSQRTKNMFIGFPLILIIAIAVYLIAQSGFSAAFGLYVTKPSFLYAASFGTLYDLLRIGIVYLVSLLTMVPLAIMAGRKGKEGDVVTGSMQVLYSVPAPIFYPLILIYLTPFLMKVFSYDVSLNLDVLIITYFSAASYIFFNVFVAARNIPAEYDMVATTYKFKKFQELRYLVFPSIIPALIAGSMAAIGSYWAGLMIGEYAVLPSGVYSVSFGLMKMIDEAIATNNLLYADAIDIFMVIVIVVMSYVLWIRLFDYSRKKYSL